MKRFIVGLFISLTAAFPVDAQRKTTREATYALNGPVRNVRTEVANVSQKTGRHVEGERILNMTIAFNEDGNRPELCLYDEKGSLARRIVLRFEGKKQVEALNFDGAGKMWLRIVNHYIEGRAIEKATYDGDGSLRSKTILTLNDRGHVTGSAEYDASGSLLDKFSYTHNAAGQVESVERSSYRADGSLSLKELQNVPEKRSETVSYNRDGSLAGRTVRVNQAITEHAADGSLKKSTLITDIGRLTEESTHNPDGTIRKESQIPDELDAHGNWTKQTKWVSDSQGTRPVKVTYRAITYY